MRRRQASFTLAIGLVAATGWSQTVDEIVARHIEARGGRDKITALQSVRMTGHVRAGGGRQASVVREVSRPGLIRLEFTVDGVTNVFAFDGVHGWQVSPFFGSFEPEALAAGGEELAAEQADIEGPLVDWKAKGHRVELRRARDGRRTRGLRAQADAPGRRGALRLPRRAVASRGPQTSHSNGAGRERRGRHDFRRLSGGRGLRFPYAIDSFASGRARHLEVTVENVELNPALDAARFRMP